MEKNLEKMLKSKSKMKNRNSDLLSDTRALLRKILEIFGIEEEKRNKMITDAESVMVLTAIESVLAEMDDETRERLKEEVQKKPAEERLDFLQQYLVENQKDPNTLQKHITAAYQDVLVDFVETLGRVVSKEKREQVGLLLRAELERLGKTAE